MGDGGRLKAREEAEIVLGKRIGRRGEMKKKKRQIRGRSIRGRTKEVRKKSWKMKKKRKENEREERVRDQEMNQGGRFVRNKAITWVELGQISHISIFQTS